MKKGPESSIVHLYSGSTSGPYGFAQHELTQLAGQVDRIENGVPADAFEFKFE